MEKAKKLLELGNSVYSDICKKYPIIAGEGWQKNEHIEERIANVDVHVFFKNLTQVRYIIWHGFLGSGCSLCIVENEKNDFGKGVHLPVSLRYFSAPENKNEFDQLENIEIEDLEIESIKEVKFY